MGTVYKLQPEIRDFILQEKGKNPSLSCRRIVSLVNEKFSLKLSKSHINSLIKQAGISSAVGRRPKIRRGIREAEGLGAIILKAADSLLGGVDGIVQAIKKHLKKEGSELSGLTESLLYLPLFEKNQIGPNSGLWALIHKQYHPKDILSYLDELQGVTALNLDISRIISSIFQEVLFLKLTFSDGRGFYLDAGGHTFWSVPDLPQSFALPLYKTKGYINKYFKEAQPLVIFTAPGYEVIPKEWIELLFRLDSPDKRLTKISLFGSKQEGLETIPLSEPKRCSFIFGLWPWQFLKYRKIESIGEFKPFYFLPKDEDFYLAESQVQFLQPDINQAVTLRGVALKKTLSQNIRLIMVTNISLEEASGENIALTYLGHWPNLEEGFLWFSRQIELFTYTALSRQAFSIPKPSWAEEAPDIKQVLANYLNALDAYVRWHFLPPEYKEGDFSTVNARFYQLKAQIKKKKDACLVKFILPPGYAFLKDLSYCLSRMNEKEILLADGKRLWCSIA